MSILLFITCAIYIVLLTSPIFMAFMFILFGWMAYVMPAVLILLGGECYKLKNRVMAVLAMTWITIVITSLPCSLSLLFVQNSQVITFPNEVRESGGIVGSFITESLLQFWGSVFHSDPKTTIGTLVVAIIIISKSLFILFINNENGQGHKKSHGRKKKVIVNNF